MTAEQLKALMDWAEAMARYESEMWTYGDMDGSYRKHENERRKMLYEAFRVFGENVLRDPVGKD